jgi:hypothetical protein
VDVERERATEQPSAGRRHYRFSLKTVVEFTCWNPKENVFGFATDISVGGAFVTTAFPAAPGSQIVIRVWPPGWKTEMLVCGVVRWRVETGMGVEFQTLGPRETQGIHALVVEHRARSRRRADAK